MSRSQSRCMMLILRHAWLNLLDKHMTTGRINQVSHQFLGQNNNSLALAKRSAPSLFQNLCAPTARRRKKTFSADETVCVSQLFANFHAVHFAVLPMQCAKFQTELAPHQGKKCGNSKLNLKKSTVPPTKLRVRPA